jgi:hypothetical protein
VAIDQALKDGAGFSKSNLRAAPNQLSQRDGKAAVTSAE